MTKLYPCSLNRFPRHIFTFKFYLFFSSFLFFNFWATISFSQAPGVISTKYLGSSFSATEELIYDSKMHTDGNYIIVGTDTGYVFNKAEALSKGLGGRPWIALVDTAGNRIWNEVLEKGGLYSHNSGFTSVCKSTDGLYVAAGFGKSTPDFIVAAYNASGTLIWDNAYGGSGVDRANSIQPTPDGGFILAGYTNSTDGLVIGKHGPDSADVWVVKIAANSTIQWMRCYGGTGEDFAYSILPTADGYIVAGVSQSRNGDLTSNNGGSDGWVFKIDSDGDLVWQKAIGGPGNEEFRSIVLNADSSLTLTGYTQSGSVLSNGIKGNADLWVIKIDKNTGNTIWSKGFGGTLNEQGFSVDKMTEDGFLVAGFTESSNGDVTNKSGAADAWLLNLNSDGALIWQKTMGTSRNEFATKAHFISPDEYVVTGFGGNNSGGSDSTDGYIVRLGTIAELRGTLIFPRPISGGIIKAVKQGKEYATVPFDGMYQLSLDTGIYTVTYDSQSPYYSSTQTKVVNINAYNKIFTADFNVTAIPSKRNLTVSALPLNPARPGFPISYLIKYGNKGTDTITSGQVKFIKDSRLNFVSAIPAISSSAGDTLKWNYSSLKPFDASTIQLNLSVKAPPAVNLSDKLESMAVITPTIGDLDPSDDTAMVIQWVVASYDPNDKTENLGGFVSAKQVSQGTYINYIIRFQNTGNDTAFNIFVRDTLDNKLDWASFQMVAASHSYKTSIKDKNLIEWTFPNIKLVDSVANEPMSHGYIIYRVKPKTSLATGDIIKNSASIYFDFNLPVKTNIQRTIVNSTQPTISSFTPTSAAAGASVTITGTNFTGATAVSFGGIAATSFTVNSSTSITAVVGTGASGNVSVTTSGGTATRAGFIFMPQPTITTFTPSSAAAGASVTITGTNFTGASAVSFGGIAATSFTVNSSTSITAVVGTGASGNVSVTTAGGTATQAGFIFMPQPTITTFTPTSAAAGASVTITGTNFTGATAVNFGGIVAASFTINSSTSITAVVGTGASGNVSVTTPGGTATRAGFIFIPQPTITSFTPTSAAAGASITITGTNFTGATAVSFGGRAATSFTINSSTSITAVVGTGASGNVSVTTAGGTAILAGFTFIPQPTITSFTPTSGAAGTSITITGTNFTGTTDVTFGGTSATSFTVNSSTSITAVVGAGASGNVSVTMPGGTATLAGFTFIPQPAITSFTPTSGGAGASITITGTNLTGATAVSFGGIAATSFTVNSSTSITAVVGTGASGNVSVTTAGGTATQAGFIFIPQPTITSLTPTSAAAGASVTITGTNFTGATAVNFGGIAATSFMVNSSTSITAIVGTGASGNVSVTTPGGTATRAGFIFIPQPTISSFTPASAGAGASITITGTNFTGATAVSFGGVAATSFAVNSATSITAVVGTGASGNVSISTAGGTATLAGFTFIPQPTISSFTPTSAGAGASITITGTDFTGATAVSFGGTVATSFTINSSTSITAVVGTSASGNVSVTTAGGTAILAGFTFIPQPTISSFTPASGAAGTSITITGTNLTGATAVSFGGVAAASFVINSTTSISAVVGTGASGDITVTTPYGTATAGRFAFEPSQDNNELIIYPNPADVFVQVKHPSTDLSAQLRVIDLTGKVVKVIIVERNAIETRIDLKGLQQGIYEVVWSDGKNKASQKLMLYK